ncbi:hypothetical protein LSTR_LSTR010594 [Laodelphax striatellus]|uniref:Proteasome subunit beta n=1 Tax=Laodelphax striatellus TaxID=195883 RepID=A0A482XIJ2_LAOST|nr:hypothetical protein LSTR_LSTR010594 [Laodelphax striatellus]
METLLGIRCNDFVMLASDMSCGESIFVVKQDEKKIFQLSDKIAMGIVGEHGDTVQFAEYISKNIQLYKMKNGYPLSPRAAANFTTKNLADSLRSSSPYQVNMLIGGYDKVEGAQLFYVDYLASFAEVPFSVHGYGGMVTLGLMDRYYKKDMSEEECYEVMKKCVREIHKRLILNLPNFQVEVINKDGVKSLPAITVQNVGTN